MNFWNDRHLMLNFVTFVTFVTTLNGINLFLGQKLIFFWLDFGGFDGETFG